MNGWLYLGTLGLLFAAGCWFQHSLGNYLHHRDARAVAARKAQDRWPARTRMEEGIDVLLWDKEIHKEVER